MYYDQTTQAACPNADLSNVKDSMEPTMTFRIMFPVLLLVLLSLCNLSRAIAQQYPVAGSSYTIQYHPVRGTTFSSAKSLMLIYAFDFWNIRYGTRLALWQNILRPDTNRVHSAQMRRDGDSWKATIDIPQDAALLSWIVGDGTYLDGNNEKTYVEYIRDSSGKVVRNARFYNIQFMKLAGEEVGTMIREMEREISDYPDNFPAYHQYFSLLLEQGRGNPRVQERISNRLRELETRYRDDMDFQNLAAQTWYYVLQNQKTGLDIRSRIPVDKMWPQVARMFDREATMEQERERQTTRRSRRAELLNAELPTFNINNAQGEKSAFPREHGRPVVLLFWASTSENSTAMIADVLQMIGEYNLNDIEVVLVNLDPDESNAREFAKSKNIPLELYFNQGATLQILGVDSLPTVFLVDRDNIIRSIVVGYAAMQLEELRIVLRAIGR